MIIVAAGGGSGGHVTPVLAVLRELYRQDTDLSAYFITDKKFGPQANAIISKSNIPVKLKRIYAGKLRRYHNIPMWRQLVDLPTTFKNLGDLFLVGLGFLQSVKYLRKVKPDVVFTKGGFVCLPVGLAAKVLGIPLVIHDSDAHPGLTNRILAKHANLIATGAPLENYSYPKDRTHYVGIPVDSAYRPLTPKQQQKFKAELGLHDISKPLLVVTGGGLGARNINRAVLTLAPQLVKKIAILHITGQTNYQEVVDAAPEHVDYIIKPFLPGLASAMGAADVIITRAGATTLLELAALGKPVIIIPQPHLPGAHQLKNAQMYADAKAAVVLQEEDIILDPRKLTRTVVALFKDAALRKKLSVALHKFAKPDAAIDTAGLIAEAACIPKKHKQNT